MPRKKQVETEISQGVKRAELLDILNKLKPGLARKDIIEHASSFTFADGLAWSYNDEIAVSHPLPEQIELQGAIPAEPLLKLLTKASSEIVKLTVNEAELLVTCGRSRAGLVLEDSRLPVADIPMPCEKDWIDLSKDFIPALKLAATVASHDISAPVLTCVHVSDNSVSGCDNFRLIKAVFKAKLPEFLLPANAVSDIAEYKPEALAIVDGWAHFINTDDVIISCRIIEGKYPDITPLLDIKGDEIQLPDELTAALDRADIFAEAELERDAEVELEADGTGILLISAKSAHGWIKETIKLETRSTFKLSVNPIILQSALRLGKAVVFSESALLMEGNNFKHVVALS